MNNEPVVVEKVFDAPVETVWHAISDNEAMNQWYFKLPGFRAEKGFVFTFTGGKDERQYVHHCEITEVVPGRKLVHSWAYEGYEGISYVYWELFPEGNKTKLRLTHTGLENFPAANPDFARENFLQGWSHIIPVSLNAYLEKK